MIKKKKYNDSSPYYADWTTKKLKEEAISLHEQIYGPASCYGRRDVMAYEGILQELDNRGIDFSLGLSFNE